MGRIGKLIERIVFYNLYTETIAFTISLTVAVVVVEILAALVFFGCGD